MLRKGTANFLIMTVTKLRILNSTQITLIFIIQIITLSNASNNPGNPILQKLLKVKQAKQLRIDLLTHRDYVDKVIKYLDEWSINEIGDITNNKDLNNEKIQWVKDEFSQTKQHVNKLSEDVSNAEDSATLHELKFKYNDLYIHISTLGDHLSDNRNAYRLLKEYFADTLPNFYDNFQSLQYQIQTVFEFIVMRENILLSNECIKAISDQEFEKAAVKFSSIKDDSSLTNIIRRVYNSTEQNFDLVINFADKVTNVSQIFIVYSVLVFEMEVNKQNHNGFRIVELISNIKTKIIYQIKLNKKTEKNALALEEFLTDKLKILTKESLKNSLLNGKDLIKYTPLFDKILLLDDNIFSEITYNVLFEVHNGSQTESIFGLIIEAFTKLLDEMLKNHLEDINVFKIASYINSLLIRSQSNGLVDIRISENNFNSILMKLMVSYERKFPESVRNIVFNEVICIFNVDVGEFLQTTDNQIDVNKFSVLTSSDNQIWKVSRSYNYKYNIQNYLQNFSYLYTSDDDNDGHNVFTWVQTTDIVGIWQIEPSADDCFIKNTLHNEYLFVSKENNHIVLTKNIVNNNTDYFKWRFINC